MAGAGTWAQVPGTAGDAPFAWVTRANGSLLVTLTTDASRVEDVLYAKADIVLAAGAFASERLDVRMSAEGLFVRATGELRLLVTQSHVFAEVTGARKRLCVARRVARRHHGRLTHAGDACVQRPRLLLAATRTAQRWRRRRPRRRSCMSRARSAALARACLASRSSRLTAARTRRAYAAAAPFG